MNGCVYRTKDNECDLWTDEKHKSFCDPDCKDKHPSNADRIRNMTDEELADWLIKIKAVRNPEVQHKILGWLKQEIEE